MNLRAALLLTALTALNAGAGSNLTIYSDGFGLVSESREIQLEKGRQSWLFDGVSSRIEPSSVLFDCKGVQLIEQNFEYDLVDDRTLMKRYLAKEVELQHEDGEWITGTLLSADGGVILGTDRGVTSVQFSAIRATRFPELPDGLRLKPALRWELDAKKAGSHVADISYITGGLGWRAEYVCLLDAADRTMEMASWVNLSNNTGLAWQDAGLQLVAGEVNRVSPQPQMKNMPVMMDYAGAREAAFAEESFFEYHLYTLERPVDLANNQDKQVPLFDPLEISISKSHVFQSNRPNAGVQTKLNFTNSEGKGPGMALPAGTVRMYKLDSAGRRQFVGEDRIEHTAVDEELSLTVGRAFDLVVERTVLKETVDGRQVDRQLSFELRNRKEQDAVEITLEESLWGDWEVLSCSVKWERRDARTLVMKVPLAAGATEKVMLNLRQRR